MQTRVTCCTCSLPLPQSLHHFATGGGSNSFEVESATVRPIAGGSSGSESGSIITGSSADGRSTADSTMATGSASDAAADSYGAASSDSVTGDGGDAYSMPPQQLVPPCTHFDPALPPDVQV